MAHCPFDFFSDGKKHTICLVGGGGKTTVMYELAAAWAACGRKVLVLTSTHILQPADGSFAADGWRSDGLRPAARKERGDRSCGSGCRHAGEIGG